jgi:hypothetical protein
MKWKGRKGSSNVVDNRRGSYSDYVSDLGRKLAVPPSAPTTIKPAASKRAATTKSPYGTRGRHWKGPGTTGNDQKTGHTKTYTTKRRGPNSIDIKRVTIGKSPEHGTGYGPRTRRTKAAIKKYGR